VQIGSSVILATLIIESLYLLKINELGLLGSEILLQNTNRKTKEIIEMGIVNKNRAIVRE
jgi:hypothetical protein